MTLLRLLFCENKNSNQLAEFFLLKHRLIDSFDITSQKQNVFSGFLLSKSKFDSKKYDK